MLNFVKVTRVNNEQFNDFWILPLEIALHTQCTTKKNIFAYTLKNSSKCCIALQIHEWFHVIYKYIYLLYVCPYDLNCVHVTFQIYAIQLGYQLANIATNHFANMHWYWLNNGWFVWRVTAFCNFSQCISSEWILKL